MTKRRLTAIAAVLVGLGATRAVAGPANDGSIGPALLYRQPAREWTEALPVGNGRLGGMVFGGVPAERIQLNEDTFWSGGPYDPINEEALQYLPKVRQLIREGRYREAQDLADEKLMGRPRHLQAYQPLGDLRLVLRGHEHATDYRRELDLDRAVVRVRYRVGETTLHPRGLLERARPGPRRAPDRRRPREAELHGHRGQQAPVRVAAASAARAPRERPLARRPRESRGPPEAIGEPARPLVRRRARVRGPALGRGARRACGRRREGAAHRGRRVRDLAPGRGHELPGTRPRGGLRGHAPCDEAVRRASRAAHGGPPLALPARAPGPGPCRAGPAVRRTSAWRPCARERSTRVSRRPTSSTGATC